MDAVYTSAAKVEVGDVAVDKSLVSIYFCCDMGASASDAHIVHMKMIKARPQATVPHRVNHLTHTYIYTFV